MSGEEDLLRRLNALAEERNTSEEDLLEKKKRSLDEDKETLAVMREMAKEGLISNGMQAKDLENRKEALRIETDRLRLDGELTLAEQKRLLIATQRIDAEERGAAAADSAAKKFLGLTADGGKMFDNWADKADGFGKKMKELLTVKNLAAAGITKVVEATVALALEQDAAAVAFNKATGQAGEYNAQIQGLERSMVNAGVSSAEAGQTFADLFNTVTDFSNMSKATQMDLAKNVALLNELGVSSSESAQSIQFLTKVMGNSTTQAASQTREIFAFAQELGVSAAGMSADFIKMQPQIAALGDTGVQAFKDLQAQAKATGMSFDSLLSITAKFDTFAGAADQVGKLNAIMGGPFLNTLEMVAETDPAERMRKLSEGINASGLSFDQMSYYQKKAMTSAAGLNSEMELAMLMSGKLESARGPVKTQADFEKLADQTKEFNTVMDEMKQFAMSLAISFGPVVSVIKTMVDGLTFMAPLIKLIILGLAAWAVKASYAAIATAYATAGVSVLSATAALATMGIVGTGLLSYGVGSAVGGQTAGFAKGGVTPGGMAMVGERGPEMVSLPKGSQVAANGSAAFNRQTGQSADTGGSAGGSTLASTALHVTVKIGEQEFGELVNDVEVKPYVNGKASKLSKSIMLGTLGQIMAAGT